MANEIKPEMVPKEAAAAVDALFHAEVIQDPGPTTEEIIAAALNAWPGMTHNPAIEQYGVMQRPYLILPLPQEKPDGE